MCATRLLRISAANIGPNRFHQNRTVSWLISMPRSASKSSTLRSDNGYRKYIITARRMTSGELLKYRNGLLMRPRLTQPGTAREFALTPPMNSLSAHALRSLIIARKKTGGPASDLEKSDPRFGGRVREHNPSIPVARCAQIGVIRRGFANVLDRPEPTFLFEQIAAIPRRRGDGVTSTRSTRSRVGLCMGGVRLKAAVGATHS
jgi:hypothetical protein